MDKISRRFRRFFRRWHSHADFTDFFGGERASRGTPRQASRLQVADGGLGAERAARQLQVKVKAGCCGEAEAERHPDGGPRPPFWVGRRIFFGGKFCGFVFLF